MGKIINLLYSLWFNLRYLPLRKALYLPILARTNLRIDKLKRGSIIVEDPHLFTVCLGGGKSPAMNANRACLHIKDGGVLIFKGKATLSEGTVVRCDKNGSIEFGNNFYCNCNCYFRTGSQIMFGERCCLGWNITLNTSDGHHVWRNGEETKMEAPIKIGNQVWITPDCSLNKNVVIPNYCIVTQKSVVTKQFTEEHCLIGGIPARIIAKGIKWKA